MELTYLVNLMFVVEFVGKYFTFNKEGFWDEFSLIHLAVFKFYSLPKYWLFILLAVLFSYYHMNRISEFCNLKPRITKGGKIT